MRMLSCPIKEQKHKHFGITISAGVKKSCYFVSTGQELTNVALGKPAYQSSTLDAHTPAGTPIICNILIKSETFTFRDVLGFQYVMFSEQNALGSIPSHARETYYEMLHINRID